MASCPSLPTYTSLETSEKAVTSLKLGLASSLFTVFTGIPAVVYGLVSLRDIRRSEGVVVGKRLAIAGVVLGLAGSLSSSSFFLYAAAKLRQAGQRISMA